MVAVVMPVYQGESYLSGQIESILGQTYSNIRLYIRDDGSDDASLKIIKDYAHNDERILLIQDNRKRLGVTRSIKILLNNVKEDVVFFADQDDVWVPIKIMVMLEKIPDNGLGPIPAVVFSDLEVVDESLNQISGSYWGMSGIDPHRLKFRDIIHRNCVTGCAAAVNRAMLKLTRQMPDTAVHDWWIACLSAHSGVLIPVPEPLVKYRQHGSNVIGAQERGFRRVCKLGKDSLFRDKYMKQLQNSVVHLKTMLSDFPMEMCFTRKVILSREILRRKLILFFLKLT